MHPDVKAYGTPIKKVGAKLGPLDNRDSYASVKGILDKLTTHLLAWLFLLKSCT